jgi:phage tail sheath protein FI
MVRPQVQVTVAAAPSRRGVDSATGTAFIVYPAASGATDPVLLKSAAAAVAAGLPAAAVQNVSDVLGQGAPAVVAVRANVAPTSALTAPQTTWSDALDRLSVTAFGIGQVLIPGVASPAAHAALVAHSASTGRVSLLDAAQASTAADVVAFANAVDDAAGSERAGLFAGWIEVPGDVSNTTRLIPPSVAVAGLIGRMDARAGHAGRIPANVQEFGDAGKVLNGADVSVAYSDADQDTIANAGANVFVVQDGGVFLTDFLSVSNDERWYQLNFGRLAMQITVGSATLMRQFLSRLIDGPGQLFAEVEAALDGYLLGLYRGNALYGSTADEAYQVSVKDATTELDIQNGTIRANIQVAFTPGARLVILNVVVQRAGEVAA